MIRGPLASKLALCEEDDIKGESVVRWRGPGGVVPSLLIYTFASLGIALIVHPEMPHQGIGTAWIIFTMLVVVVWCMVTERGIWPVWRRLLAVPGAWVLHGLLTWPASGLVMPFRNLVFPELLDYFGVYLASVPLVLWAMWHSRVFVEQLPSPAPTETDSESDGPAQRC